MSSSQPPEGERMLTFELRGGVFALPISEVLEVAEAGPIACVPTLPRACGGVMNWHGDALPVVQPEWLLSDLSEPVDDGGDLDVECEHVLVVAGGLDENVRVGLPADRVLGLVDMGAESNREDRFVDRRPVDGRVVGFLDPCQLVARAAEWIERSVV